MNIGMGRIIGTGLALGILLAGCGKQQAEVQDPAPPTVVTEGAVSQKADTGAAISGAAMTENKTLEDRSRRYAEQIAAGLYDELSENFSQTLQQQLDLEDLKASWESVVAGASGYEGISKLEESENNGYQIILVTLRYQQNQGRTIQFIYDEEEKIAGIWFDTVFLGEGDEDGGITDPGTRWSEEEITVGRDPYVLQGKITIPSGGKAPVVILVAEQEDADQDGSLGAGSDTPLRDLAYGLAEDGVASLRFNRRLYEYDDKTSAGDSLYDTLYQDVWYAVDQMYNDKRIDRDRIYLLAMGRAADYLPAMVKKKAKRLSGAVMMAAKPVSISQKYYSKSEKDITSDAAYFMEENSTFPLLMLQGEEDSVTDMEDFEQWKKLWKGRSHVMYRSYQYLDHSFVNIIGDDQHRSVSQSVIEDIAAWCQEDR